jgi:hypothetical protein
MTTEPDLRADYSSQHGLQDGYCSDWSRQRIYDYRSTVVAAGGRPPQRKVEDMLDAFSAFVVAISGDDDEKNGGHWRCGHLSFCWVFGRTMRAL